MSKMTKLLIIIGMLTISTLPITAVTYNVNISELGRAKLIDKYNEMEYGDVLSYPINSYTHVTWVKLVGGALVTTVTGTRETMKHYGTGQSVHTIFIKNEDIGR